jgi:hypothetical protein
MHSGHRNETRLDDMEQRFGVNSIDLQELYDFCEREGEKVSYQKGERMECEGEPSRWFGFVSTLSMSIN